MNQQPHSEIDREAAAATEWWTKQSTTRRARWLQAADDSTPLSAWRAMVARKGRLPREEGNCAP